MSSKKPTLTSAQFDGLLPKLTKELTKALEKELKDCAWNDDTDLWDLPTVDSKTVCKLSPVVQSNLGRRLEPQWVRKGGYQSVFEAVQDVLAQARKHCVSDTQQPVAKNPSKQTAIA